MTLCDQIFEFLIFWALGSYEVLSSKFERNFIFEAALPQTKFLGKSIIQPCQVLDA